MTARRAVSLLALSLSLAVAGCGDTTGNGGALPVVPPPAPPVIRDVVNGEPPVGEGSQTFLACVSTPITIHGTGFVPGAVVHLYDAVLGPARPLAGGTLLPPVVVTPTSITGLSPRDASLTEAAYVAVKVTNPDGRSSEFVVDLDATIDPETGDLLSFDVVGTLPELNVAPAAGSHASASVAVDPSDPSIVVVATGHPDPAFTRVFRTTDRGASWSATSYGMFGTTGGTDPVVRFDDFGNGFLDLGLTVGTDAGFGTFESNDHGVSFLFTGSTVASNSPPFPPARATGPSGALGETASVGIMVGEGAGFTQGRRWTGLGTAGAGAAEVFGFGSGLTDPSTAIGPDGALYVSWVLPTAGGSDILLGRDLDGVAGAGTFGSPALVASTQATSPMTIPALPDLGARVLPRLSVFPVGPRAGRIVVVYVRDNDPGPGFELDVVAVYSDDSGLTFSAPVVVHAPSARDQFTPEVAVDPVTGVLYASWWDARADAGNARVHRYVAASRDGVLWTGALRLTEGSSLAPAGDGLPRDLGNVQGLAVHDGCGYAAWSDTSNATGDNPDGADGAPDVHVARFQLTP